LLVRMNGEKSSSRRKSTRGSVSKGSVSKASVSKASAPKPPKETQNDRMYRQSVESETKIRSEIEQMTKTLSGLISGIDDRPARNTSVLEKLKEDITQEKENDKTKKQKKKRSGPGRNKNSLKDGPKRTISLDMPMEVFEEMQLGDLKDEIEENLPLEDFLLSQDFDEYLEDLQDLGVYESTDLAALEEADLHFITKMVHRSRMLWICTSIRGFFEDQGRRIPILEIDLSRRADRKTKSPEMENSFRSQDQNSGGAEDRAETPDIEGSRQKISENPPKKAGRKAPPVLKKKVAEVSEIDEPSEQTLQEDEQTKEDQIEDQVEDQKDDILDVGETEKNEEVLSLLPPQPSSMTRLVFKAGPFGITVYGTGAGLVVTHVEPEGAGNENGIEVGDHILELNGILVKPDISDRDFVEQLMSLSRPVVIGFSRNGRELFTDKSVEPKPENQITVGGVSMDEVDPAKDLAELLPSTGLGEYVDVLKDMGADKMEDLAYLRRSDLQDLEIQMQPSDKKKLLELGLVAFLTKEGLADCVAYIRSVGVDMVDDLVYLKQSDVALMDLNQDYKRRLLRVLDRDH